MDASAREYATGPAGYNAYNAGFLCGDSIVLQRGVRDLNSDSGRAYLDSYTLVPTKGPEAALGTSALEAAESTRPTSSILNPMNIPQVLCNKPGKYSKKMDFEMTCYIHHFKSFKQIP